MHVIHACNPCTKGYLLLSTNIHHKLNCVLHTGPTPLCKHGIRTFLQFLILFFIIKFMIIKMNINIHARKYIIFVIQYTSRVQLYQGLYRNLIVKKYDFVWLSMTFNHQKVWPFLTFFKINMNHLLSKIVLSGGSHNLMCHKPS